MNSSEQQRAVMFSSAERRRNKKGKLVETGRILWYVKVTAKAKPLLIEKGRKKGQYCLGEIREQWPSREEAADRKQRIDEFFFPTTAPCAVPPLTLEQQKNCALVLNGHCLSKELGTDWGNEPDLILRMYDFCRRNKMPLIKKGAPLWVSALDAWIKSGEQGDETNTRLRADSRPGRKMFKRLTGVVFKSFKPGEVAVDTFLNWVLGRIDLNGFVAPMRDDQGNVTDPGSLRILDKDGNEADYEGELPFPYWVGENLQKQYSSFINWCSQYPRFWCQPLRFKHIAKPRAVAEANTHQAMSIEQFKITLQWYYFAGWLGPNPDPGGATYAAYAVQNCFGGTRKTETKRGTGLHVTDGLLAVETRDGKCNPRVNKVLPVFLIHKKYLERRGLWEKENLNLNDSTRSVIHYLAGWDYEREETIIQAERFLRYCEEHGIKTPERGEGWGPYPANGMRDLALSMHIKLFFDQDQTSAWGGTSGVQLDNWYFCPTDILGHRFTLDDGREYWLHLTPCIIEAYKGKPWLAKWGTKNGEKTFGLPLGHMLEGHLGPEMQAALEELDAGSETAAPNPLRVQTLEQRLTELQGNEKVLLDERAKWHEQNPDARLRESPNAKKLKNTQVLIARALNRLELARKGIPSTRLVSDSRVCTMEQKQRWVNLVAWMSRLTPHIKPKLAEAIGVDFTTFSVWLKQAGKRVPMASTFETALDRSVAYGYDARVTYVYLPAFERGLKVETRWDSLVGWLTRRPSGFLTHFAKSIGVPQTTVSQWCIRGSKRMPLSSLRVIAEEKAISLGWTPNSDRANGEKADAASHARALQG